MDDTTAAAIHGYGEARFRRDPNTIRRRLADPPPSGPTDERTGKPVVDLSVPTCHDNDLDPDLIDKTPEQMDRILRDRDENRDMTTEQLMQPGNLVITGGHSSGGRRRKPKPKPISATERVRDDGTEKSIAQTAEHRAAIEASEIDNGPRTTGAPRIGTQARIRVQGRMEPGDVLAIHDLTGKTVTEYAEASRELLELVANNASDEAIADCLARIMLPQSAHDAA